MTGNLWTVRGWFGLAVVTLALLSGCASGSGAASNSATHAIKAQHHSDAVGQKLAREARTWSKDHDSRVATTQGRQNLTRSDARAAVELAKRLAGAVNVAAVTRCVERAQSQVRASGRKAPDSKLIQRSIAKCVLPAAQGRRAQISKKNAGRQVHHR